MGNGGELCWAVLSRAQLGDFSEIQQWVLHGAVLSCAACGAARCECSWETQSSAGLGGLCLLDTWTFKTPPPCW